MKRHRFVGEVRRIKRQLAGEPGVRYQVLGERCSGTNFLERLIEANFGMRESYTVAWKHGFPDFLAAPRDVVFAVTFREVFGWLSSLYAKPWHSIEEIRSLSFSEFIREPWITYVDKADDFLLTPEFEGQPINMDVHPVTGDPFESVLQLRDMKMRAALSLPKRGARSVFTTQAELASDPQEFVRKFASEVGLEPKDPIVVPDGHYGWKDLWAERKVEAGKSETLISEEDRAYILANLDLDLERQAGFSYTP